MRNLLLISLFALGACSWFKPKEDVEIPVVPYEWVAGPIVHPITGKMCSVGYCKDEPVPAGKSGCHSADTKCSIKK